jgi:hypothetical protein
VLLPMTAALVRRIDIRCYFAAARGARPCGGRRKSPELAIFIVLYNGYH